MANLEDKDLEIGDCLAQVVKSSCSQRVAYARSTDTTAIRGLLRCISNNLQIRRMQNAPCHCLMKCFFQISAVVSLTNFGLDILELMQGRSTRTLLWARVLRRHDMLFPVSDTGLALPTTYVSPWSQYQTDVRV